MTKKIIVTSCSLNYIAQAKCLGDSIVKHAPDYHLVIGLIDKINGRINKADYAPHEIVEAEELNLPQFADMAKRYTMLELSCAAKIFFAAYALKKYNASQIIFMDCDIMLFDSLKFIEEQLNTSSILITPHIATPYPIDGKRPFESDMLKNGIFNAGFFAFNNDDNGKKFVEWMKPRMIDQCYVDIKRGLNADQGWFNFVPVFFQKVMVVKHPGCNAAYWNLHERIITKAGDKYMVNGEPLIFFHYSGYSTKYLDQISRHQDRVAMNDALKELFKFYHDQLLKNDHEKLSAFESVYKKKKKLFGF